MKMPVELTDAKSALSYGANGDELVLRNDDLFVDMPTLSENGNGVDDIGDASMHNQSALGGNNLHHSFFAPAPQGGM
jgi:hypothetical protein